MEIEYQPKPGMVERNLIRYLAMLRQLDLDGTIRFDESGKVSLRDPQQGKKEDYFLQNPFLPQFLKDYTYGDMIN